MTNEYIAGSVLSVLRYPVKSMMGEELTAGSARGIGKAIAERYGSLGASLVVNYSLDENRARKRS
jgi:hypothetical protein